MRIYSIGHGTRPVGELIKILNAHGILQLVDVRSYPGSRRNPQYGREVLADTMRREGIQYDWMPDLGGRRRSDRYASLNFGWKVDAFRAYADYMDSPEFARGILNLLSLAAAAPTAFMCAET